MRAAKGVGVLTRAVLVAGVLMLVSAGMAASAATTVPAPLAAGSADPIAVAAARAFNALTGATAAQSSTTTTSSSSTTTATTTAAPAGPTAAAGPADEPSLRAALVALVAARLRLPADALASAWAAAGPQRMTAVYGALAQVGVAYGRNQSKPGVAFDCSGLTTYAWRVAGVTLRRTSSTQLRGLAVRTLDQVQPGDIFWYPGHVMLALGVGKAVVHAVRPGHVAEVAITRRVSRVASPLPIVAAPASTTTSTTTTPTTTGH